MNRAVVGTCTAGRQWITAPWLSIDSRATLTFRDSVESVSPLGDAKFIAGVINAQYFAPRKARLFLAKEWLKLFGSESTQKTDAIRNPQTKQWRGIRQMVSGRIDVSRKK